jgi:hypothetical protein
MSGNDFYFYPLHFRILIFNHVVVGTPVLDNPRVSPGVIRIQALQAWRYYGDEGMVPTKRKEQSERFHSVMKEPQTTACGVTK